MLSTEKCKNFLKDHHLPDKDVEEVRDVLYQLAELLVNQCRTDSIVRGSDHEELVTQKKEV